MLEIVSVTYLMPSTLEGPSITLPASVPRSTPAPVSSSGKSTAKKRHLPRAEKMAAQNAHYALVLEAAQTVTRIFERRELSCAVFGSLAAKLYGSSRVPKDVDLLVSQEVSSPEERPLTAAELKELVINSDPRHFYLKLPRDPAAEYRILWYRQEYKGPECKVDILVPGSVNLPRLPRHRVMFLSPRAEHDDDTLNGEESRIVGGAVIPVVPFALLLAHKLQGWDDHRRAEESHYKEKQHQDAADVRRLLGLRREMKLVMDARRSLCNVWNDKDLFSEDFERLTYLRVKIYCAAFPDREAEWRSLGFETVECVF
ncbi:hypothetical protein BDN70DRAFT_887823 [Pholiota conissans]|uniref:Nucleotidyltransferase n=1 Tax=Pholiota conissans TaxID=109636 RepID=A0A9P5YM44_9AGAR|nr:hypothetical protein BDN70DRAFT_887823 [Pholiota conissans]